MRQPDTLNRERYNRVKKQRIELAFAHTKEELFRAMQFHRSMASPYDAYAVILKELDEAWDLIKKKRPREHALYLAAELRQVAAMCIRAIIDLELDAEEPPDA